MSRADAPLRVGFVLCSSVAQPIPSTRIAVLNMLPYLRSEGIDPYVLFEPTEPTETPELAGVAKRAALEGCDIVVLQKVHGPSALALVRELTAARIVTIFAVCDLVKPEMVEATTATVIVTEFLRSLYPPALQSRMHVVHDGIERPNFCKTAWGAGRGSGWQPLRAVLVASTDLDRLPCIESPPPWLSVRIVARYSNGLRKWRETRWQWASQPACRRGQFLRFLLDPRITRVPWGPDTVYREMSEASIGVIPVETPPAMGDSTPPGWQTKSENRLTMKMSIGLPVVATPIPSYERVIEHGVNGFFARSPRDWAECLEALRDPARRREMGQAAHASVARRYSMDEQAVRLVRVLKQVATRRP
jgi:hypothetical protein